MNEGARIFVAGHGGLVGSAIVRSLRSAGYRNLIFKTHAELDLTRQSEVDSFFKEQLPEFVILAAAKVGGIASNSNKPADFIRENLQIQTNVIHSAYQSRTRKLVFLGSSCIYPRDSKQPIAEKELLTGPLESTNESYAIAKIAGIRMCQAYRQQYGFDAISIMPTNLYGPGDNFDLDASHVLPALIRKFHEAKTQNTSQVVVWGTGRPKREFMHVDDLADAVLFLSKHYSSPEPVNVGVGKDITIHDLALLIADVVGFHGEIVYDTDRPDGTPRKLLDVSRLEFLGWKASIALRDGITQTYAWFQQHMSTVHDVRGI